MLITPQLYAAQAITFYHNDLLGSPVAVTDINGDLCWREDYRPYGEKLINNDEEQPANPLCGLDDNQRGYTNHVHDKDIGLTYMQARYYDPAIGRFMGTDPNGVNLGIQSSFSIYAYGGNNPYKYVDPDGREISVSVIGNDVVIGITAEISGPGASVDFSDRLESAIEDSLTGTFGQFSVTTDATIDVRDESQKPDKSKHQFSVRDRPAGSKARIGGVKAWVDTFDSQKTLAHETGHLFGLFDEYREFRDFRDKRRTVPFRDREQSIMATSRRTAAFLEGHIQSVISNSKDGSLNRGIQSNSNAGSGHTGPANTER